MIRAVLIDIDNTLLEFDAFVRENMEQGFRVFGLRPYEPWMYDVFTEENNRLWNAIEDGLLTLETLQQIRWNRIFERLGIRMDGVRFEQYFRESLNESAIPVEGAQAFLSRLSGRFRLFAASNGPYAQQIHRLDLSGMLSFFEDCFISEEIGCSKPSPEFFSAVFKRIRPDSSGPLLPGDTAIVGDSASSDMAGGRAFGMRTCHLLRGRKPSPEADFASDRLSEIADYLLNEREKGEQTP